MFYSLLRRIDSGQICGYRFSNSNLRKRGSFIVTHVEFSPKLWARRETDVYPVSKSIKTFVGHVAYPCYRPLALCPRKKRN